MNKTIKSPKRSEIDDIMHKMNGEVNKQLTKQNRKVESIGTTIQELAAENKTKKERENNRETVVVEAFSQSKDTVKDITQVHTK